MNWPEFLQSDEFRAYRKKQIEVIGSKIESYIRSALGASDATRMDFISGALNMANELINLPEKLTEKEEIKRNINIQRNDDIATLTQFLVRRRLEK